MTRIHRALFIITGFVLALLVPEGVARLFLPQWKPPLSDRPSLFVHHADLGWSHPASSSMDHYGGVITSNSLGLRDLEPGKKTKPRVIFLGDSFTWGWGIGQDADRYVNLLQRTLPDFQLINAGIIGFNTLQEYLLLKHYGDVLQPDYVVLQIFQNDFRENLIGEGIYPRPYLETAGDKRITNYPAPNPEREGLRSIVVWLGEHTYFYRQVMIHAYLALSKMGASLEKERSEPAIAEQQEAMITSLQNIIELAREKNLPLLIVYSGLNEMESHTVQSICGPQHVRAINLDRAFDGATEPWQDHTLHWTVYGHDRVADYLQVELAHFLQGAAGHD